MNRECLFTRIASVGGIAFLVLFYVANPPFVGYFYSLPTEGSYLIVNKNLVEVFALCVVAAFPGVGFLGLEALEAEVSSCQGLIFVALDLNDAIIRIDSKPGSAGCNASPAK